MNVGTWITAFDIHNNYHYDYNMATMKMMARHFPKVLSTKYFFAYFLFLLSFIPVVWIRSSNKVSFECCFLLMAEYFPQVFGEPNTPLPLSEVTTISSKGSFDCCFLFSKWKIVKSCLLCLSAFLNIVQHSSGNSTR